MTHRKKPNLIALPNSWPKCIRSAMLHVISLAQYAVVYTRSWAADSRNTRVRLKAENGRLKQEVAMLQAEIRIKDSRMQCLAPHRRPFYPPAERMEILQLRAARGWSIAQTADVFLVTAATIASWMNRLEEEGPEAHVQLRTPANKFPEFVRYAVERVRALCPTLGKKKLAQVLARAGLHLGATTIGRIRKAEPRPTVPDRRGSPDPAGGATAGLPCVSETCGQSPVARTSATRGGARDRPQRRVVTAKRPNHVLHVDLTAIPTFIGPWCPWWPFSFPQRSPFCGWLALVVDHYSRRIMGFALFRSEPTAVEMRTFLGRVIHAAGRAPRHLISDKGCQFWPCAGCKRWCRRYGIKPRWGAVGKHGSIAVVERTIKTIKEQLSKFRPLPLGRDGMRQLIASLVGWHNEHRPHTTSNGCTRHSRAELQQTVDAEPPGSQSAPPRLVGWLKFDKLPKSPLTPRQATAFHRVRLTSASTPTHAYSRRKTRRTSTPDQHTPQIPAEKVVGPAHEPTLLPLPVSREFV